MDLQSILQQKDVKIIDVREPYEYMTDRIFEAENLPLSRFSEFIETIKKTKEQMVFYCRSGNRSGQVVEFLKKEGLQNVHNGGSLQFMRTLLIKDSPKI